MLDRFTRLWSAIGAFLAPPRAGCHTCGMETSAGTVECDACWDFRQW